MLIFMFVFWALTFVATLCAMGFVIPPLWLETSRATQEHTARSKFIVSALITILFTLMAYTLYAKLGQGQQLSAYYKTDMRSQRNKNLSSRAMYAKLQREVVRSQLNINVDLSNLDLILSFATAHAELNNGILSVEIQTLLDGVLKVEPRQITSLNLLAINAYKTTQYSQAIGYWQRILDQLENRAEQSATHEILTKKIAIAKQLESKQTKYK